MSEQIHYLPLSPLDKKKIRINLTVFIITGLIGAAIMTFSIYVLIINFSLFFVFLLISGLSFAGAGLFANHLVNRDFRDGRKRIIVGILKDKYEEYHVSSGKNSSFRSTYHFVIGEKDFSVDDKLYHAIEPGQKLKVEETVVSSTFLNAVALSQALKHTPAIPKKETVERRLYSVHQLKIADKIISNVRIKKYKPRKSSDGPGGHYLVITNKLYKVDRMQFDSIPIGTKAVVFVDMETEQTSHIFTETVNGEKVELR